MFSSKAKWIWLPELQREKNSYALFKKTVNLKSAPKQATIKLTADTRYELYVNDIFIGHGPVRAWPSAWPVDEFDIRHLLRDGDNEIRILVTHFGISTFQYIHADAGLIAQIDIDDQATVTDASWQCSPSNAHQWPTPRITCQQAWEEQFDARIIPTDWKPAKVLDKPPHETLVARDIPMLTQDSAEPLSIRSIEIVRPCNYSFALNPREFANSTDKSANHIIARMMLTATIKSDHDQKIDLHQPHTRPFLAWRLNGKDLKFDDKTLQKTDTGVAHATLKKGDNVLLVRLAESEHHWWANLNIWTEHPVKFTPWLAAGPFAGAHETHVFDKVTVQLDRVEPAATAEVWDAIWKAGKLSADELHAPFVRELTPDMVATTDAYATCVSDRVEPSIEPHVENANAMLHNNAEWTTIHPVHDGTSVRILFDYGRETIGFQEFEIDAPAGTIVDVCNFEFIQRDGRFNLNESMNNSFRYTCRDGVQKYKTFLRRGLKYSWLVVRNFNQPVRIRRVGVLQSTYPQTGVGSFECSDPKLTQIWSTGVRSVECCSEDTYTDCPTYEQTLWVGDARNEAIVDLVANGDPRLSARCLKLTGQSLERSPIVESQVPSGWQNLLPTWVFLWMRWAQEHYQLTGDKEFAREMLIMLDRNFAGIKAAINSRGLFEMYAWNLFDWAPMDTPAGGIVTHISCLASLGLKQTAQMARDLGDQSRAKEWSELATSIADAVNKHLWSEEKQAYVDCIKEDGKLSKTFSQQTQTAAYISGVATGDRAERCRDLMHNPPKDFVKAGSPFFMFFLLEALVAENKADQLIPTIRDYWGKQIDAGATTFWEMYQDPDTTTPFSGASHRLTRSHCHGWSAAPTFFLTQFTLGVRPLEPGYAKILVQPNPGELTWAQGRIPTPRGPIGCYWRNADGRFDLSIESPRCTPVQIDLPRKGKVKIIEGNAKVEGQTVTANTGPIKLSVSY